MASFPPPPPCPPASLLKKLNYMANLRLLIKVFSLSLCLFFLGHVSHSKMEGANIPLLNVSWGVFSGSVDCLVLGCVCLPFPLCSHTKQLDLLPNLRHSAEMGAKRGREGQGPQPSAMLFRTRAFAQKPRTPGI